jgi:hypothetical protein
LLLEELAMDSTTPHIPSPSVAWSRLAASQGENPLVDAATVGLAGPHCLEDASQLRARLLRMIVDSEHSRKTAAAEAFNGR